MKGILKLGIILMLFATAACVGLAFVYSATEQIIAQRTQADLEASLMELFPDADGFEELSGVFQSPDPGVQFGTGYVVHRGAKLVGAALQASTSGYGGVLRILIGVGTDGSISHVKIMEHSETPGLGANSASPTYFVNRAEGITFYGQFQGKPASDPFIVKEDVSAITAATITSRAVTLAAKVSSQAAYEWLQSQGGSQ